MIEVFRVLLSLLIYLSNYPGGVKITIAMGFNPWYKNHHLRPTLEGLNSKQLLFNPAGVGSNDIHITTG